MTPKHAGFVVVHLKMQQQQVYCALLMYSVLLGENDGHNEKEEVMYAEILSLVNNNQTCSPQFTSK